MPVLDPPIVLELPENEVHVKYILEIADKTDYDFPAVREVNRCLNTVC